MLPRIFLTIAFLAAFVGGSNAQSFEPYHALIDPLAIADLGDPDSARSLHTAFANEGYLLEPDGYRVFVSMEGTGVVSHLWMTQGGVGFDVKLLMKIYVDDSLLYDGTVVDFFLHAKPPFASPLVRQESGGLVCDLQIPYQRNFRITSKGKGSFVACSWRALSPDLAVRSFIEQSAADKMQQLAAESNYSNASFESNPKIESSSAAWELMPGSTTTIIDATGAGVIRSLQFIPRDQYQPSQYRDLWLECYWDEAPVAAIEVPLSDFFGAAYGMPEIRAMQLKVGKEIGLQSELPMPFRAGAIIRLVNRGSTTVKLSTVMGIERRYDREFGRLFCQFNETRYPRVKHLLPILHVKGKGRAIGVMFNMPSAAEGYWLEGDPQLIVDSNSDWYFHYPGTEDYFNGGWYFQNGPFTGPFAGCPIKWSSMYRFHYLDRLSFGQTADWDWQHGANSDYPLHYRTVSFCYLEPRAFWTNQDSLIAAHKLRIEGAGFEIDQPIPIKLGDQHWEVIADQNGRFSTTPPEVLTPGMYSLVVNAIPHTRPIVVLSKPVLEVVRDSLFTEYCALDSVEFSLRGFTPNSIVRVLISGVPAKELTTNLRGNAWGHVEIGIRRAGEHQLQARDSDGELSTTENIHITPTLRYEVEDMTGLQSPLSGSRTYMGWWPYARWSNCSMIFADPANIGDSVAFSFSIPTEDSFRVELSVTKGLRYGNVEVAIDGLPLGVIDCFFDTTFDHPMPLERAPLGVMNLRQGQHTLRTRAFGRDPRAVSFAMGIDALYLTPLTDKLKVSAPNPRESIALRVHYNSEGQPIYTASAPNGGANDCSIDLFDGLGRLVASLYRGQIASVRIGRINVQHLASGIYFVRLESADEEKTAAVLIR